MLTKFKNHDEKNKGLRVAVPLACVTGVIENQTNTMLDIVRSGLTRSYRVCETFDDVCDTVERVHAEHAEELLLKIFSGEQLDAFETRIAKRLEKLLFSRFANHVDDLVGSAIDKHLTELALETTAEPAPTPGKKNAKAQHAKS